MAAVPQCHTMYHIRPRRAESPALRKYYILIYYCCSIVDILDINVVFVFDAQHGNITKTTAKRRAGRGTVSYAIIARLWTRQQPRAILTRTAVPTEMVLTVNCTVRLSPVQNLRARKQNARTNVEVSTMRSTRIWWVQASSPRAMVQQTTPMPMIHCTGGTEAKVLWTTKTQVGML